MLKISCINFMLQPISVFDDFAEHCRKMALSAASDQPDLIIFPEMLTLELLPLIAGDDFAELVRGLAGFNQQYQALFSGLAFETGAVIAAGSTIRADGGNHYNTAYLFRTGGGIGQQDKLHLMPIEKTVGLTPGSDVGLFDIDGVKAAVLTCYDIEFPEAARLAALRGVQLLINPSATTDEAGFWRVRHCGQARCVENLLYVAASCLCGPLSQTGFSFWGRSGVLTPCDTGFPAGGIAAQTEPNRQQWATTQIDTSGLPRLHTEGSAPAFTDRRGDIMKLVLKAHETTRG